MNCQEVKSPSPSYTNNEEIHFIKKFLGGYQYDNNFLLLAPTGRNIDTMRDQLDK